MLSFALLIVMNILGILGSIEKIIGGSLASGLAGLALMSPLPILMVSLFLTRPRHSHAPK